ncbi:hypothetical protein AB0C76_35745 [Kitasatospora sp. NPDC048722]|uniref:hypothetical protein n=1 Tax=Kitasatospora sp. NPDC048722 TaxID=3155639 RepID=UPI003411E974
MRSRRLRRDRAPAGLHCREPGQGRLVRADRSNADGRRCSAIRRSYRPARSTTLTTATGAQLEITTDLRAAMFAPGKNTRADRAASTLPLFWNFASAIRTAVQRLEATQPVL